jgi:uncharacterized protein (UPF0264 family)
MLTVEQIAIVKALLLRGDKQQDIAAFLGENGGRVAEISIVMEQQRRGVPYHKLGIYGEKNSRISRPFVERIVNTKPAAKRDLPSPAVVMNGYSAFIALQALEIIEIAVRSARERILALHPDLGNDAQ